MLVISWIIKKINSKISSVIKDLVFICTICGIIIGIANSVKIINTINDIKSIFTKGEFTIQDNILYYDKHKDNGYIGDIQYFIDDQASLNDGNDIKNKYIDNVNYIIILKDGIQCNAGIVGMNNYLDSQNNYTSIFNGEYIDNNKLQSKLSLIKIISFIVINLESILYIIIEFLVQVLFLAIILYFINCILNNKITYAKAIRIIIYTAFIPKLIISILQSFYLNSNFSYIMFLSIILGQVIVIVANKRKIYL